MPTALIEQPVQAIPPLPPRKAWTRGECAVLVSTGLLDGPSFELVEGELIRKMGKNRPHSWVAQDLLVWLIGIFGSPLRVTEGLNAKSKAVPMRFSVPLGKLEPGRYTCQVNVVNPEAKKFAVWRAPMVLLP